VTRSERLEAIERARLAFYQAGRGCFLRLRDGMAEDEERYGSKDEIKAALANEPDAKALVAAVIWAVGTYDPIREAVVVESIRDEIRVLVVREDDAEDVGGIEFSATPTN
jgi:hypothetical protein